MYRTENINKQLPFGKFGVVMQIDEKKRLFNIESINDKSSKQISRNKSLDKIEFANKYF